MAVVRRSVRVEEVGHIAESVAPRRLVEREAECRGRRRRLRRRGRAGAAVCLRPRAVARVGRRRRRDLRLLKGATRREHDGGAEQQREQREQRAIDPAEGGEEPAARATLPPESGSGQVNFSTHMRWWGKGQAASPRDSTF